MCKERRATFQKTEIEEDGTVHPRFSVTFTRIQGVVSILVGFTILVGSMVGAAAWTKASIVDSVSEDFQNAMDSYYKEIIPERNEYYRKFLDSELMKFEIATSKPIEARLDILDSRVTTLEAQGINVVKILDRHELLLLEILRRMPDNSR